MQQEVGAPRVAHAREHGSLNAQYELDKLNEGHDLGVNDEPEKSIYLLGRLRRLANV